MPSDLIIPVYLNQRVVFDLIAMLQDGIAMVKKVSEAEQNSSAMSGEVGSSFGLNKAFSALFKVDFSGKVKGETGNQSQHSSDEERVYTPASLFYKLRQLLQEKGALENDGHGKAPKPGDIFEFNASLKRNPVIEVMDVVLEMLEMADMFTEQPKQTGGKKRQNSAPTNNTKAQIRSFADALKAGGTVDLTTDALSSRYRAVVTLETQYLNDPSMADLVDGTFSVLGKVVKSIPSSDRGVNLMRKTALSRLPEAELEKFMGLLQGLSGEQGFNLPQLEREIKGPVIHVLPIAIYA